MTKKKKKEDKDKISEEDLELMRNFDDFPSIIRKINLEPRIKGFENLELEEQIKHAEKVIGEKLKIDKFKGNPDLYTQQIKVIRDSIYLKKEHLKILIRANKSELKKDIQKIEKDIEILLLKVDDIVERREHAIHELEKRMEIYDYLIKRISLMFARRKYEQNKKKRKEEKDDKEKEEGK